MEIGRSSNYGRGLLGMLLAETQAKVEFSYTPQLVMDECKIFFFFAGLPLRRHSTPGHLRRCPPPTTGHRLFPPASSTPATPRTKKLQHLNGKTHTMHGDQNSPGIIPLAIKDVFSIIQDTPGREFLLRVSYLEIYNEVINDLLDPTDQNLRVREDAQGTHMEGIKDEVVLSPGHALSFIAAGEDK